MLSGIGKRKQVFELWSMQAFISLDKANSFQAFSRMYLIRWVAFTATDTRSLNVKNGKLSILRSSNVRTVSRNGNCNLFRNKPNSQQPTWFQPPICHFLLLSPSFFFKIQACPGSIPYISLRYFPPCNATLVTGILFCHVHWNRNDRVAFL